MRVGRDPADLTAATPILVHARYLRDLMDADAATEANAEVIARIARMREPVDFTMDDILAARDEGRR